MSATITIHRIKLVDAIAAGEKMDSPLYVELPDGRELVIWPSGGFTVKVPQYAGQNSRYAQEVEITLPTADDLGTNCNELDGSGNFKVIATHRH